MRQNPPRRSALMVAFLFSAALAFAAGPTEYQLKAVFLFNFSQFVEWPARAFPDAHTPLVIGVLGPDPFGADLDGVVQGETVNGRSLVVRRFNRVEDIGACHILFISSSEGPQLARILESIKDRNVLTVTDGAGLERRGVMIGFVNDKNRIRLRINLQAAEAAGLKLSSKLLRPAEIVATEG
jgi:hypothetical protein